MDLRHITIGLACALLASSIAPGLGACEPGKAQPVPDNLPAHSGASEIRASYDARLAAIDLGTFDLTAIFTGKGYALSADGKFSLLSGLLYRAEGKSTSKGTLKDGKLRPKRYTLSFSDSKKRRRTQIIFSRGEVSKVTFKPKKRPNKNAVPIPPEELSGVLDPLTAAFLSIRSKSAPGDLAVCNRTIRVFDGKQRFDLTLSPKRSVSLEGRAPKNVSKLVAVCQVRYEPIGGHRPQSTSVQYMKKADGVEAWLVKVPGSDLFLPYKVVIPTGWGNGSITLKGVDMTAKNGRRADIRP